MKPEVSIIMGIYNCAETLGEAIDSILTQTYTDWELILCDDGSTDDSYLVAQGYVHQYPNRIILIRNEQNLGLNRTLNRCLELARGTYIARMDGDDRSLPERLERQVALLESRPEIAIVSSPMEYFDENGVWGRGKSREEPTPMDFVSGTPFCHAPCMVRSEAYRAVGGYSTDERTLRAEDYDLWFRMYEAGFRGYNLQTPYYQMRDDENAYRRRLFRYSLNEAYVRFTGYRRLKLPMWTWCCALRPILVALLPRRIYMAAHHVKKVGKG